MRGSTATPSPACAIANVTEASGQCVRIRGAKPAQPARPRHYPAQHTGVGVHQPRLVPQIGELHPLALEQRMIRCGDRLQPVVAEHGGAQITVGGQLVLVRGHERGIHLTRGQRPYGVTAVEAVQGHGQIGVRPGQPRQQTRQQRPGRTREAAQSQRPAHRPLEHGERLLGLLELTERPLRVLDEQRPRSGQPHPARHPLEQIDPHLLRQHLQLLGHGGRRQMELLGRSRDGTPVSCLDQHPQPREFKHEQILEIRTTTTGDPYDDHGLEDPSTTSRNEESASTRGCSLWCPRAYGSTRPPSERTNRPARHRSRHSRAAPLRR